MTNVLDGITSHVLDLMFLHLDTGFANTVFRIELSRLYCAINIIVVLLYMHYFGKCRMSIS